MYWRCVYLHSIQFPFDLVDIHAVRRKRKITLRHTSHPKARYTLYNALLRNLNSWFNVALSVCLLSYGTGTILHIRTPTAMLFFIATGTQAAGGDDNTGPGCPMFEGINASFMPWFIAFCAWVAWKKPELSGLIHGTSKRPRYADPSAPTATERKRRKEWTTYNTQLYGAVVSHVAPHIQTSLHLAHAGHGVNAVTYIKNKYGAHSTGDRAEAIARLQKSVIDPRSKISEDDVTRQYTAMSMAVNDIIATGGAKIDDATLISMMENALPPAYAAIRQMLRYHQHTSFETYFNDLRTQVKAEERSSQATAPTAFIATHEEPACTAMNIAPHVQPPYGKGGRYNGNAKGKGKGGYGQLNQGGRGRRQFNYNLNPCFNCGKNDHPRFNCPCPLAICIHCGANHISEMCSKGPGGPLRDALSYNAKLALERNATKQLNMRGNNQPQAMIASNIDQESNLPQTSSQPPKIYLTGKRPASVALDSMNNISLSREFDFTRSPCQRAQLSTDVPPVRHRLMSAICDDYEVPDLREIDEYLATLKPKSFMVRHRDGHSDSCTTRAPHSIAYTDSQASSFVVPDESYLTKITDNNPQMTVDTANGPTHPDAIGEAIVSMFDDDGGWHSFIIQNVWVIRSCNRVLYSQGVMKELGVIHRLDEGYIEFEDGTRKRISNKSYAVELTFGHLDNTALVTSYPALRLNTENDEPEHKRRRSTVPQQLVWQRLGCPSLHVWTHVADVLSDHGLPPQVHLKHDFQVSEAVARARARLKAFHDLHEPTQLPAPGAVIF